MGIRRNIGIALVIIIMALLKPATIQAQAGISSPQIHCIDVDSIGDVTLYWTIPNDTNRALFQSYDIFTCVTYGGVYSLKATVTNMKQNSVTINGLGANAAPVYFYINTQTSLGSSTQIDTLESIYLNLSNPGGMAILTWNPMSTPNLPTFNGWYKIYKEYPQYVWTLIDSTKARSDTDTIRVCSAHINYRIVTNDASGCQSSSNWNGSNFKNIIQPSVPLLDTISVSSTNSVQIGWNPDTTTDVIGYVVYVYNGTAWIAVDTVWGYGNTFYNYTLGSPGSGNVDIEIAALDSCKNISNKGNAMHTLYLTEKPDKCEHLNALSWNPYVNLVPGVLKYEVMASVNGGAYKVIGTTKATTYVDSNLNNPQTICYFIRVVDSIKTNYTASSNVICYTISLPPPPKFAYLNDATVINNSSNVQVECYVDTDAGVANYIFERAPVPGGKFAVVGNVPAPVPKSQHIAFIDPSANPNNQSYTYYVVLEDSCQYYIDTTNIGQTIFLTAIGTGSGFDSLKWNDYQWWKGNVLHYDIYRDEDGGPYAYIGSVPFTGADTNIYIDNVSSIVTGQGIFCYYIQAIEGANGYPFTDTSTSNIGCAYQDPRLYVPNAFNPKGINKIFIPVGVFVNITNYDFTIYNRWGQLLFETNDPTVGWDGTYHGRLVDEDVYAYRIQYNSSKGEYFDKKGTVLMLK